MRSFPFISRRSHDAIVAEKSAQVALLTEQAQYLKELEQRGRAEKAALEDKLVDALKVRMVEDAPRRRRVPDEDTKAPETLDLSMVDPNDNEALVLIARREMPQGARVSATALLRTVEKLREQVIEAHAARMRGASTPVYVPQTVSERIAAAEHAGVAAAQIEVGV